MGNYSDAECLIPYRDAFYRQDENMWPWDFQSHYRNIPIWMPDDSKTLFSIRHYISTSNTSRQNEAYNLRRRIKSTYGENLTASAVQWLDSSRMAACFAGHGLPEELSFLATYAVHCGFKSAGQVKPWAEEMFGLDCNGFANAYFTAIKTFEKTLYYIPSYPQHASYAKEVADITYDSAVCFARIKGTDGKKNKYSHKVDWEVRPNPGNGSHIMVAGRWEEKHKSLKISQMSSSHGLATDVYDVLEAPDSRKNERAIWQIRRRGSSSTINVMISQQMPRYIGKAGAD